jgi:squalene synthase HpnC
VTAIVQEPVGVPTAEAVMTRAGGENFPVASRLLAPSVRSHLLAVYGYARLVDELGDAAPGDRLAALDWLEGELDAAYRGQAEHPLLVALQQALQERPLPRAPFERLIEANRVDQRVGRYRTWEELRGYCALSADPVGELVLCIFELATPARIELSNSICTALQLAEHCQDVAEDLAQGRIYMPLEDLERFGCTEADLAAAHAGASVRALLAFEVARARALLRDGAPLLGQSRGTAKLALAAFLAGGHAALDAIERQDFDVLAGTPRVSRTRHVLALAATLARRPGRTRGRRRGSSRSA